MRTTPRFPTGIDSGSQAEIPVDPTKQPWAAKLAIVRQVEAEDIRERRAKMRMRYGADSSIGPPQPLDDCCSMSVRADAKKPLDDLVGVALSGGGIRSAAVCLGLLQALHKTGLIKFVDYLSTVSGGGYAGSAYSAAVQSADDGLDTMFPSPPASGVDAVPAAGSDRGYPAVLRRIIYGGEYLFRPWEAANKYLVGLFFNNLLLMSGLVVACTAIALVWRSLDYQAVRDALAIVYLDWDAYVTFLPFCICLICWVAAWSLSYFRHGGEAPGLWAQRWLYLTVASFLIGVTLLLVNGETTLGAYGVFFGGSTKATNTGTIGKWLLAAIAAALTPLLAPKRLLQMGLAPRGTRDRVVFATVLTAFCVGVPLAVIGIVGQENISRTRDDPNGNVRLRDIRNWPAFASLLGHGTPLNHDQLQELDLLAQSEKANQLLDAKQADRLAYLNRRYLASQVGGLEQDLKALYDAQDELDQYGLLSRLWFVGGWPIAENPVSRLWRLDHDLDVKKQETLELFNKYVLPSWYLPFAIVNERHLIVNADPGYWRAAAFIGLADPKILLSPAPPEGKTPTHPGPPIALPPAFDDITGFLKKATGEEKISDADLRESIADARLSYQTVWRDGDSKGFNLALLEQLHPECFYAPNRIYRFNVIAGDQKARLWILIVSSALFLASLLVDLNSTSLHRFYRNRLAYAYIGPFRPGGNPDIQLSELRTTDRGAPYHILNATVDLRHKTSLAQANEEYLGAEGDQPMEQIFIYSRHYCGCQATGWARTEHYEQRRNQNVSLANAMALSGAAVSALMSKSATQRILMLALNLNLGQWVPNPKVSRRHFGAFPASLVRDWYRRPSVDGRFCFISDGGFTDNLGVFTLLRRRCRLIVAMDAGCDGKHQFEDLGRIVRAARVHLGVRIVRQEANGRPVDMDTALLHLDEKGLCKEHHLVAKILYPKDETGLGLEGWLVYMKSSLTGDESTDILGYRDKVADFPHETTVDQFYEPARMETYRQLGMHIGRTTLTKLFADKGPLWDQPSLPLGHLAAHLGPVKEWSDESRIVEQATDIAESLKSIETALRGETGPVSPASAAGVGPEPETVSSGIKEHHVESDVGALHPDTQAFLDRQDRATNPETDVVAEKGHEPPLPREGPKVDRPTKRDDKTSDS